MGGGEGRCGEPGEVGGGPRFSSRGRCGLAVVVSAPAGDGAVALFPARVHPTRTDRAELTCGRSGLATVQGADDAGVTGYLSFPPASDRGVGPNPTSVRTTRADRGECTIWRRGLASGIETPAGDAAIHFHATREPLTCADRGERACGRRGFAVLIVAPADDGAIVAQRARVCTTRAERGREASSRRGGGRAACNKCSCLVRDNNP